MHGQAVASGSFTLMLPWLECPKDQVHVYGESNTFTTPEEQEASLPVHVVARLGQQPSTAALVPLPPSLFCGCDCHHHAVHQMVAYWPVAASTPIVLLGTFSGCTLRIHQTHNRSIGVAMAMGGR